MPPTLKETKYTNIDLIKEIEKAIDEYFERIF